MPSFSPLSNGSNFPSGASCAQITMHAIIFSAGTQAIFVYPYYFPYFLFSQRRSTWRHTFFPSLQTPPVLPHTNGARDPKQHGWVILFSCATLPHVPTLLPRCWRCRRPRATFLPAQP
uniref:Uncharacterized protein n=1 Tax=Trypanosoma congolense (strain IL3000) TaxID=1068625 RepID=G0ULI5_TRYCI|nr:hypothetical protein, unlikely [Trypanosoma congolense IL3000]